MSRSGLFPTPIHGRLVLLLFLVGLMLAVLTVRLATLSLARGGELRAQAEAVLLRERWIPAARGSIVDRKGRVLAQDRPMYNILATYDVLAQVEAFPGDPSKRMTTRWARNQAHKWARRLTGHRWMDLTKAEQAERRAAILPVFEAHLEKAWADLSQVAGVPSADIEARKVEILKGVEWKYGLFVDWRLAKAIEDLENSGRTLTPEQTAIIEKVKNDEPLSTAELKAIGAKSAERQIAEQQAEHVILPNVADEVGFSCILMEQEQVELALPSFDAGTGDSQFSTIEIQRFPGLEVEDAGVREYPFESATVEVDMSTFPGPLRSSRKQVVRVEGVACHILGRMRSTVFKEDAEARTEFLKKNSALAQRAFLNPDVQKNDRGDYRSRDRVGAAGIESSQEHVLRGLRGVESRRVDTGAEQALAPEDGKTLHLTLDIALQAKIQAIMSPEVGLAKVQSWQGKHSPTQTDGEPLFGAAVVIDLDTAEILAMVSTPTFTREQLQNDPKSIFGDDPDTIVSTPGINKAIAKAYVPGSIVKAPLLAVAESRGVILCGHAIDCTGHLFPDRKDAFRCWIYKMSQADGNPTTHTDQFEGAALSGPQALMVSCNIYFFTLGKLLGVDGILSAYKDFGVGTKYDLGIGYEHAGQAGRRGPAKKQTSAVTGTASAVAAPKPNVLMNSYDAIQMGIGQGPITWTPVHAADSFATLARGGVRVPPRIIRNGPKGGDPVDLGLKAEAVAEAMQGLKWSVNENRGTGNHVSYDTGQEDTFDVPGITVWGKTGTATASPIVFDPDGDGPLPGETLESGDHSWFVVLAGKDRPQFAIAVVIDFGGSGGKVSGPIANQIIHALQAEGYFSEKE
jgi:penicillin-binding protein 2